MANFLLGIALQIYNDKNGNASINTKNFKIKYTRDTLTTRIGDHGANESNFLSHDKAKFNVSIVISDKMIVYDGDGERTLIEAHNCATKAVDFIPKGVNIDGMLPDSVKAQEDAELSDITLYTDERVRVVNVRRDSRIRFFFTTPPDADRREQLKRAARTDAFPCGLPPLCTRFGVFGYAYTAKQIHEPLVDIVVRRAFLLFDSDKGEYRFHSISFHLGWQI